MSLSFTKHHSMKSYGSGDIAPLILKLGTIWRRVVSFTPLSLYPPLPGKEPLVPIGWEAWWAPKPIWMRCWKETNFSLHRTPVIQPVAWLLYCLSYP